MSKKITVAVLFGGRSPEHYISKLSATAIISNMSYEKYNIMPILITEKGEWLIYDGPLSNLSANNWERYASKAVLSPDTAHKGLLRIAGDKVKRMQVDVVFPVLHGKYGEDGAIQGLLELSGIPYVGCGILTSGICMDKAYTKKIVDGLNIRQAKYDVVYAEEPDAPVRIEKEIGYPCFVKPADAGSSVGISKAKDRKELHKALQGAVKYGKKILVEEYIAGREVECAILGGEASPVGEIVTGGNAEFYDYDAKYNDKETKTVVPADIPAELSERIRDSAVKIFKAIDGRGLARIDFFIEEATGEIVFNEVNTMPGFTGISMYPLLWKEAGLEMPELIDRLISMAKSREANNG